MTTQLSIESLSVIAHNGIPVITTDLLAQLYGTDTARIRNNFARNKERFTDGKHYYKLTDYELRDFKHRVSLRDSVKIPVNSRALTLWTQRGAARHAKMLETDQAWEVFEKLEDCYFSQREKAIEEAPRKIRQSTAKQLIPLRQTAERLIATGMGNIYPDIWKLVHQRFDVEHIHQLPPDQIGEAIDYLEGLEGEWIGKQKQAVSLPISYPMEYFDQFKWMMGQKAFSAPWNYPANMLIPNGDYPNPLAHLLHDLRKAGYQVEAAQFQLLALQHHLEMFRHKVDRVERAIR
ncbi:ORF6N domain-containing protein|uniref:ORF6N domain-containing protein n=1 Tax=Brenneria salicis ATCC 15712 = DSM 30166 TaxID=714314 RepID=A0A366HYA7_9GAMM|nr:ORF6N domain-containing protein [Brenneria salicis ATCC 15712 = DSM 30166]RBP57325.1 ORF6N domain-containing protein [Brenneria salicis ATCC 15712 = DSM 30166]